MIQRFANPQTGSELARATLPPGFAWIRSGIRLAIAGAILAIGYPSIALIVGVLAVISLIASAEAQVARVLAKAAVTPVTVDDDDEAPEQITEKPIAFGDRQKAIIERQQKAIDTLNGRVRVLQQDIWFRREVI